MSERTETDLESSEWDGWIAMVCARLGIDPVLVDVTAIHALTREVAHRYDRPMAPVSAFIVGVALGGADATGDAPVDPALLDDLIAQVEATLPGES